MYYCTLLDEKSPLKLNYDITKNDTSFKKNMGNKNKRSQKGGVAKDFKDFGYERIHVSLHIVGDF